MIILVAIVIIDVVLLGATVWSARARPAPTRARIRRGSDDLPYAL